jgi:hypothetical protein
MSLFIVDDSNGLGQGGVINLTSDQIINFFAQRESSRRRRKKRKTEEDGSDRKNPQTMIYMVDVASD